MKIDIRCKLISPKRIVIILAKNYYKIKITWDYLIFLKRTKKKKFN